MSFAKYPEYKDSGDAALGLIPSHWRVARIGDVAKVVNGYPFDSALFHDDGAYPLVRIRDLGVSETATRYNGDFVEAAAVTSSDVLIGMDGDFNVGRWLGTGTALLNQRMCCIRTSNPELTKLLEYALPQPLRVINDLTYATTVKHLSSSQVEKIRLGLAPDRDELSAIVGFLDHETAKIDALVAEQEKLITLLQEKRQAVISHAVTKGLNPNAPMKDSGVKWLGKVPEHWAVCALSYLSTIETGSTPDRNDPRYWNGSIPWLKTGEINWAPIREADEFITEEGLANSAARLSLPGTMLMAMYGQGVTRGRVALLEIEAAYNQACAAISFGPRILPTFGRYFFMAAYDHIREGGNETSQMNLSAGLIAKFRITVPPIDEQTKIVDWLDAEFARLEALSGEVERAIALLQERRTALISAAVTGQFDVRGGVSADKASNFIAASVGSESVGG